MAAAHRGKAIDKQDVCKKLHGLLKKHYPGAAPKSELPVLETLLYAVCLEDSVPQQAEMAYARMLNGFHDLNEVRVSSIYELETIFEGLSDPAWRALRLKNVLQFVFESTYSFDFDGLRRKPTEQAVKMIGKIPQLSAFVRHFAMQNALGVHVLPIDERMRLVLVWLGLVESSSTLDSASETLRAFVRKADAAVICHLLRMLSTDPKYMAVFDAPVALIEHSADEAIHRLEVLFKQGVVAAKKLDAVRVADAHTAALAAAAAAPKPKVKSAAKTGKDSPKDVGKEASAKSAVKEGKAVEGKAGEGDAKKAASKPAVAKDAKPEKDKAEKEKAKPAAAKPVSKAPPKKK